MLEELLIKEEGKTLEFKQSTQSLQKIIQTIIAFANTSGGTVVIGIKDKTKEVVGLANILQDEEKIAGAIADSVAPLLFPTFHLYTWRDKDVLIISVPHSFGPYYLKSKGIEEGVFMRLGSTNRVADKWAIAEIQRLRRNKHFDEQPNFECPPERIQLNLAKDLFAQESKKFTEEAARSLGLIVLDQGKKMPSNGAVLLFAENHKEYFPDAIIRLGRFLGADKSAEILDQQDLEIPLSIAIDPILMFVKRHTSTAGKIGPVRRVDIPQYPHEVLREAIINALLHADYSMMGAHITIAIFNDRIEITNPGALPLGHSLESALAGISQLRNWVIGRTFRELNLIEQWGSGLRKMITVCRNKGIQPPKFEEIGSFFRVTLYHAKQKIVTTKIWQKTIIAYLHKHNEISAKQAQKLWKVTTRTTSSRLKEMCEYGLLVEIATSPYDPYKTFSLAQP